MSAQPDTVFSTLPARVELLTMAEVAGSLKISRTQAYRLAQIGALPAVRFGALVRVHPEDLENFIAEHRDAQSGAGRGKPAEEKTQLR